MHRVNAVASVLSVRAGCLRLSQVKTWSELLAGALVVPRVSLAHIGWRLLAVRGQRAGRGL